MTVLEEGRLRFTFSNTWQVQKFDSHRDYRDRIQKLQGRVAGIDQGTKAVDFVARRTTPPQPGLYFIELKDYSRDRIQNHADLIDSLTLKVRDTISGLVVAYRTSSEATIWQSFVDGLVNPQCRLFVIWFVKLASHAEKSQKAKASVIMGKLKTKLKCIGARVFVIGDEVPERLPDVSIEQLPRSDA